MSNKKKSCKPHKPAGPQKPQERFRGPITQEELDRIKEEIQIGDKITWEVLNLGAKGERENATRIVKLTVTRKSRFLFEAADSRGRIYSVRYAEVAEERRKDEKRTEKGAGNFLRNLRERDPGKL